MMNKALLRHALPLLAVPFLPSPLAALVVLSSLTPSPALANDFRLFDDRCRLRAHAICTVYRYVPDGKCVDRSHPLDGVPCGQRQLRLDGASRRYCHVRTLEIYNGPPKGVAWRVLSDHVPVADPEAVAATGRDVCYVELEHLDHREGHFILCPVHKFPRFPFLCCLDTPYDPVIWERRKLTRGGAVVWDKYNNGTIAIDDQPMLDEA